MAPHYTFTAEMENEIMKDVLDLEQAKFPITKVDRQRLAFQFAERNKGIAGQKGYGGCVARHPELSLRRWEATSLARAGGFNKEAVKTTLTSSQSSSPNISYVE